MNSITRHDILNKVTILLGALEIAEMECNDPAILYYFNVLNEATKAIQKQIEFTRLYQDLGIQEPAWLSPASIIREMRVPEGLTLDLALEEIVIFADPMLEKVFHNLLDNSIRHGETVSHIRVSGAKASGGYVIAWEDNGIGIRDDEKETIFKRGHGKNTGLGLFLAREILALTGITITETGTEGKGARFEIMIPNWFYSDADGTGTDTGTKLH
jgi:signal transduction histidine kinase